MSAPFAWTDASVRRALGLDAVEVAPGEAFTGVSTDTRTLAEGALFVALRGPRFDGHDHLAEAAARGARAAVVSRPSPEGQILPLYAVPDTLVALGQLARFRRRALGATVVALTGSTGKTTVKDLLREILSPHGRVHATRLNLNNRIGVPLTLLSAPDEADQVIVELGTSERGEIGILTRIAEPDLALLTTVTEAHLDGLGSLEGVMEEKLAILTELRPGARSLVGDVPAELPRRAREVRDDVRVAGFSDLSDPDLRGAPEVPDEEGRVPFRFRGHRVRPGLPGRHGAAGTLLALAVAVLLEIPLEAAVRTAAEVAPGPLRGERRRIGGLTLLLDCYNANPQSMRAALDHLASLPEAGGRVAVLGSMLELGDRSDALHREVLEEALRLPLSAVVAVGAFAEAATAVQDAPGDRPRLLTAATTEEARERLRDLLTGRETVLLKGSRGMAMERLVPHIQNAFGDPSEQNASGSGEEP